MPLKKFTGNFILVTDDLSHPALIYQAQASIDAYNDDVKKDIERTRYLSYTSSAADMKQRLSATEHLEGKTYSYSQGNFDGGVFYIGQSLFAENIRQQQITRLTEQLHILQQQALVNQEESILQEQIAALQEQIDNLPTIDSRNLRISYTNDSNELMALNITCIRDDSDLTIPLETRPLHISVVIIKNPHFAPEERGVTFFAPEALLDKRAVALGLDSAEEQLWIQLSQTLESTHLEQLLFPVFNNPAFSFEHYNDLSKRLKAGINIDDRDNKKIQLERFFQFVANNLSHDKELANHLEQIKLRANTETNFFQEQHFAQELVALHKRIEQAIDGFEELQQSRLKTVNKLNLWIIQLQLETATSSDFFTIIALQDKTNQLLAAVDASAFDYESYQEMDFAQIKQQVADSRMERVQLLQQQVLDTATKLKALVAGDNVPEFIRNAFWNKAHELVLKTVNDKPERLNDVPSLDILVNDIFSIMKQQEQNKINDDINTQISALPVVAKPQEDTRTFFGRNWPSLSFATGAILLTIGLILIASGILAPIGLALTGLALIATMVGAASAAALVVGAGIKIASDEIEHSEYQKELLIARQRYNEYTTEVDRLAAEKDSQYAKLETDLLHYRQSIEVRGNYISVEEASLDDEFSDEEYYSVEEYHPADDNEQCLLSLLDQQLDNIAYQVNLGNQINLDELPEQAPQRIVRFEQHEIEHKDSKLGMC